MAYEPKEPKTEQSKPAKVTDELFKKPPCEHWLVGLEAAPDHQLAPYMDRPRIVNCEKHEAVAKFKEFYGIIATIHNFRIEESTPEAFAEQTAEDKRRAQNIGVKRAATVGS